MKTSLHLIALACATLAITACKSSDDFKVEVPKIEVPKFDPSDFKVDLGILGCAKEESTQDFSRITQQDIVLVEGALETQETEAIACDKSVQKLGVTDTKSFDYDFFVGPESQLSEAVASVEIENSRSCSKLKLDVQAKDAKGEIPGILEAALFDDGNISLAVTSMKYQVFKQLLVRDGKNLVQVRYMNAEGKEIGSQEFVIDLQLKRTQIDGVRQVNVCTEKKSE